MHLTADYVLILCLLTILVVVELWRERRAVEPGLATMVIGTVLFFFLSRMMALSPGALEPLAVNPAATMAYVFNLASLSLAGAFLARVGRGIPDHRGVGSAGWAHDIRDQLFFAAYGAFFGVFFYLLFFFADILGFSAGGLLWFVGFFVEAWLAYYCWTRLIRVGAAFRGRCTMPLVLLTASWLALHFKSLGVGESGDYLLSKSLDIGLLLSLIGSVQSNRRSLGSKYREKALAKERELARAREELNRMSTMAAQICEDNNELIRKQREQSETLMRKVDNLEKILAIGVEIQKKNDLKELLQMIVRLIKNNLGFETVILRLLNEKARSFETKAFVGLSGDIEDMVTNYRIPVSEFERTLDPCLTVGKSYLLRRDRSDEEGEDEMVVGDTWKDVEMIIVPLLDEAGKRVGYLSVEEPVNTGVNVAEAIETLEVIASLAVIGIKNASLFKELGEKNEKLRTYADKLKSLNKMKSNFVATISHEFRTPLTSVKAACETMLKNVNKMDKRMIKRFLMVINEESDRLMALIEDILDFSQMESGSVRFERAPCNLSEMIRQVARELDRNFRRKKIRLQIELPPKEVVVRGEVDLLKQLVTNLLHNAAKFTHEGGNVRIKLQDDLVTARLIVEDDGIGIPDDQLERIFDHFHQVDSSITRRYGGSGLGLAIVKNVVDWHDGRIWVENIPTGGARFVAVIPKKQAVVRSGAGEVMASMKRFEVERYLELLIEMVVELLSVKRASIMLLDEAQQELTIESAVGIDEDVVESARVKMGEAIAGRVAKEGETMFVEDIEKDPRICRNNNDYLYESKSFLSVPLKRKGSVLGVVNVANPSGKSKFSREDQQLLELFVERMALAVEKLEEYTHISMDFENIRNVFKSILDSKRYMETDDNEEIAALVMRTAEKLGLEDEDRATLAYVLNVYDLGLAKVGYHIVRKSKQLSPKDRSAIEKHTIMGSEMLQTIENVERIKDIVLYHHENYDGSGYPGKLSGEMIPIGARIIRVVDSFRALISPRPYQKQYTLEEALEVLKHRSGTFFDPKVVDAFIEAVHEAEEGKGEEEKEKSRKKAAKLMKSTVDGGPLGS